MANVHRPPVRRRSRRGTATPVFNVAQRRIDDKVRLLLWVQAGGRCEFDGCNEYLLEHHLTRTSGNYGQAAHIVAFSPDGPRGQDLSRPRFINNVSNLMLLCPPCHKLIDDNPYRFNSETLREYKRAHEARIIHLTELGPAGRTAVLVLKAPIRGQVVSVPFDQVVEATAPHYPASREPVVIDLTTITDSSSAFLEAACDTIKHDTERFFGRRGEAHQAGHVSVFAMAPIPLLIFLGRLMTSKIPTDLYQRHRDKENWTWKMGGSITRYSVRRLRHASSRGKVALILSLSGTIRVCDLPDSIRRTASIYSITLAGQTPRTTFLRTRQGLEEFRTAYQEALGLILQNHGRVRAIDIFPAVPAPIAVLCGREPLPKVHPGLRIWDYDQAKGGFTYQMEV